MSFSRRTLLKASAASAVLGGIGAPLVARAQTAEFTYKYANNLPDGHPMNARAKEMAAAIKAETNGRFDLQIFPNNQLGSDTDMLSQLRSGGVEFFTLSGLILATLVPAASINGIGFAFPDYDRSGRRWTATSAPMSAARSPRPASWRWTRSGTTASARSRRRPSRSTRPDDLKGFKIRVPVSPLWTSMFKAFDASPASINFSEVYSALQTKIVEGQENPLAHHLDGQALRGAEVLLADQPHVGRLLVPGQRPGLGEAAGGPARPSSPRTSTRRRSKERDDVAKLNARCSRTSRQGPGVQPARRGAVPRQAARGRLLRGMEGQVRRRGLGAAREVRRQAVVSIAQVTRRRHGSCRMTAAGWRRGGQPPRRRSARRRSSMPWACWSRSRRRCWSWPRSSSCSPAWSRATCFHRPLIWSDELASILFLWLAMLGAVVALRRGEHMRMTALVGQLRGPPCAPISRWWRWRRAGVPAADRLAGLGIRRTTKAVITTPALEISNIWRAAALPVGIALMVAVRAAAAGCASATPRTHAGAIAVGRRWSIGAVLAAQAGSLKPLGNLNLLIFFVGVAGVCVFAGVPIAFAFGLATFGYLALTTRTPLTVLVGRMDEGMSHLILLAVPLFVFLGLLIEMTGMARAMVAFLASLLGHVRGGLSYVLVGAMYLVSGISGSKAADMAAVAPVLFPEMKPRGAKPGDLVALLAATGAQTETIPPSLVLITIGSVTGVSIAALFTGGLLPALVLAITLCVAGVVALPRRGPAACQRARAARDRAARSSSRCRRWRCRS